MVSAVFGVNLAFHPVHEWKIEVRVAGLSSGGLRFVTRNIQKRTLQL